VIKTRGVHLENNPQLILISSCLLMKLATRITDCQPKVIVSASAGVEPTRVVPYQPLLQRALELTNHKVNHTIMVQRRNVMQEAPSCELLGSNDYLDYDDLMAKAKRVDAVPVASDHPHYVLYTSGTTGLPKGVVRDTGGGTVALKYSMDHFYNMNPGDVFWAASDIGWVVGHSYIVYAPLLHGCTAILYEGKPVGTPDAGAFWRVLEEYQVKALFVAPTAFRAMKQVDPNAELAKKYDLSSVETIFLAGEHSDPETMHWIERATPGLPPPIDHWWQTELGWYVRSLQRLA
jgi:propionyl-CoA synthetase